MPGGRRGERSCAEDQREEGRYQEAARNGHSGPPPGCPRGWVTTGTAWTVGAGFPNGSLELPDFSNRSVELPTFPQIRPMKARASGQHSDADGSETTPLRESDVWQSSRRRAAPH